MQSLTIKLLNNIHGMERNIYDKKRKKHMIKQYLNMIQFGRERICIRKESELIYQNVNPGYMNYRPILFF